MAIIRCSICMNKGFTTMQHPAFEESGSNSGIEIWTIDKFEPVSIDQKMYGKFYNGDSYIVLKTTGQNNSNLTYDAHFWLGSKTTQDKRGAAAILTVTLDDMLGGRAVQHREVQGHESSQFLGYFKPAIRYMEGGLESGFNEVETNAGAEKRLLKLSGCDNMRIEEVPAEASSLTREHCFILEADHDIFVLMPESAKATQRRKIIDVANTLRDDYHNGRATIEIIDDFSSDEDIASFFEALGSGSKDDLPDGDQDSETYSRGSVSEVYLYKVLDGDEIELEALSKPYKQKKLGSDEIYILDTPCSGVYVWLGKAVAAETRKKCNDIAQQYLDIKGYPSWVNITRVTEGSECATFKQYFHHWDTVSGEGHFVSDSDAGYFSADTEEAATSAYLIGKSAAARGYMPDHGEGNLVVTRVAGGPEDITEKVLPGLPVLYQSEVHVVKYQYETDTGEEAYVAYVWIGKEASDDDKKTAADFVKDMEDELEGKLAIVQVPQGKEPKHLLNIFKGHLAILFGGRHNDYQAVNSRGSYDDDNIRLFRVEGTELGVDMRGVQVAETAAELEDDDVFVLETAGVVYVWQGKESTTKEQEAAQEFVQVVVGDGKEVTVVQQGEEPAEFWEALGGAPDEKEDASGWRQAVSRRVTTPPSLTSVTVSVTGKVKYEELSPDFTQQDLSDDGVYILDAGEELYMWQGANIPERVKMARTEVVKNYIIDDGLERTPETTLVVIVKQGREPGVFKKMFPGWEEGMWDNQTSYEDIKTQTKAANSK